MQAVAIFNNKGGVGKTTLLCNLASFLAKERNKRILIVDADPQCNATQSIFGDEFLANYYEEKQFTITSIVNPLSKGKGFSSIFKPIKSDSFGLDVLVGNPDLGLTEDLLATDWVQATSGDVRGMRTTLLFRHLLEQCEDYDFVFFDMGPSLGSINRAVLLSSDFYLTPMAMDIFSVKAIANISKSLKTWGMKYQNGLNEIDDLDDLEVMNPEWKLKYVGYVTQQYTFKRDGHGTARPVKAFDRIMRQIPNAVDVHLNKDGIPLADLEIGLIPTLHSLVPLSQTSRKPIFDLSSADGVVGAHFSKVREFRTTISKIADKFLANIDRGDA